MKLGNILRDARSARPINPKPVEFYATGVDADFKPVKAKVAAIFQFVSEDDRQAALVRARQAVRKRFPDQEIPEGVLSDEEVYHILFEALRDAEANEEGVHPRLCESMDELRGALVMREAHRLWAEYTTFLREEFPTKISDDEFERLVEEAKKSSLRDLLTSCGYEKAVTLLTFLAGRSGR